MFNRLSSFATRTQNQSRRNTGPIPILLAAAMLLAVSSAAPAAPATTSNNFIAVYATSAVSKEDISQVMRWTQRNGLPTHDAGLWNAAKNAPARIGRPLTSDLRPPFKTGSALATLVLVSGSANCKDALSVTNGIARLDVSALRRVNGTNTAMAVQLQYRLCGEALRGIGLALGLAPCPMPLCCMMTPQSENALDRRGTNYCPPCSDHLQKLLRERGAEVKE